jgi:hypothetical protein
MSGGLFGSAPFQPASQSQPSFTINPYIQATLNLQQTSCYGNNGRFLPIPAQLFQLQQPHTTTNMSVSPVNQPSQPSSNGLTTPIILPTVPQIPQTSHQPFSVE